MNEQPFEEQLETYLDGAMPQDEATRFEQAIAESDELRQELQAARRLADEVAALPQSIEPPRDLWTGIESKLQPRTKKDGRVIRLFLTQWGITSALAAAAVALFAVWLYQDAPRETHTPVATAPAPVENEWQQQYREAEIAYEQARQNLVAAIEARDAALHPETQQVLDENLQIIDGALNQITAAIETDPENPMLVRKLMATREKELSLLERMVFMPEGV